MHQGAAGRCPPMLRGETGCQGEPWCGVARRRVASRLPEANIHVPVRVLHVCVSWKRSSLFYGLWKSLILALPICLNFSFARRHSLMWNISQGCTTGMPAPTLALPSVTSVGTASQGSLLMASPVKVGVCPSLSLSLLKSVCGIILLQLWSCFSQRAVLPQRCHIFIKAAQGWSGMVQGYIRVGYTGQNYLVQKHS